MNVAEVKNLVDNYSMDLLIAAEKALIEDTHVPIAIGGEEESEKLTHVLAAVFILEKMKTVDVDFNTALRDYTRQMRESIG